jgi:hypothetical protein
MGHHELLGKVPLCLLDTKTKDYTLFCAAAPAMHEQAHGAVVHSFPQSGVAADVMYQQACGTAVQGFPQSGAAAPAMHAHRKTHGAAHH